jgi:hypothetical protein
VFKSLAVLRAGVCEWGKVNDPNFGEILSAADPRLVQLTMKFFF